MSDNQTEQSGQKILGIPVENITKLSYILILVSTGFALLLNFLGILGVGLPGTAFFGGIGLFAVFLSLVSLFVFEERFSELDKSHFKFIALAYVTFFVALIVVGTILSILGSFGYLITFLIAATQFLTFYTGFKLHKDGELADKDNLTKLIRVIKRFFSVNLKKPKRKQPKQSKRQQKAQKRQPILW